MLNHNNSPEWKKAVLRQESSSARKKLLRQTAFDLGSSSPKDTSLGPGAISYLTSNCDEGNITRKELKAPSADKSSAVDESAKRRWITGIQAVKSKCCVSC